MGRYVWDLESVTAEAKKYSRVIDFKAGSRGAYEWAVRNDMIKDVTAFMSQITDPDELLEKITGELGSAARHAMVANEMWEAEPYGFADVDEDPEQISAGTYLDFEAQMHDQAAFERSDRALDHIEALQEHGTPEQVKAAWDKYLKYQNGDWNSKTVIAGYIVQGEENE